MSNNETNNPTNNPNYIIPEPATELLSAPEQQELLPESTVRELGEKAIVAGSETEQPERLTETELEELLKSRLVTEAWAVENGYTEAYPIEYRILEPTDMPGYGGVRNRLAHVMLLGKDMVFVDKDGGFEPRLKLNISEEVE